MVTTWAAAMRLIPIRFWLIFLKIPGTVWAAVMRLMSFSQAEKLFSVVTGTFFFCKINDFAWQYHLFCVAIPIRLCTKINYIAGKEEGWGRA